MSALNSDGVNQLSAITSQTELRKEMVSALHRRIFGPSLTQLHWRTAESTKIIADGSYFPEFERPIGPFTNANGDEVLPVIPRNFYHTGILWGIERDIPLVDGVDELFNEDRANPQVWKETEDLSEEADSEDLPEDIDELGRRRSMSLSFRTPDTDLNIEIDLTFGTYSKITAKFNEKDHSLWMRTPQIHNENILLSVDNHSGRSETERILEIQSHRLRISWIVRREKGSRLITVAVTNITEASSSHDWEPEMFQVELSVAVPQLEPYAEQRRFSDPVDLLYRDVEDLAIGHGTDVRVSKSSAGFQISTVAIPVVEIPAMTPDIASEDGTSYAIAMDDLADFNESALSGIRRIIDHYEHWIGLQRQEVSEFDGELQRLGTANVESCQVFLEELRSGFELITSNNEVRQCLQDASRSMFRQRIASSAELRPMIQDGDDWRPSGSNPHLSQIDPKNRPQWRPFQIAFILASLPKIVNPQHSARQNVDVIWMPTGGGKTEAYLGLAAFVILWERSQAIIEGKSPNNYSTKVLMRYTLRLLTIQQFLRSASLICALELLRQEKTERYGKKEIRIGAWVGSSATPNKRKYAVDRLRLAIRERSELGFLLTRCPWCSCQMSVTTSKEILGYRAVKIPSTNIKRVLAYCPDSTCHFRYRSEMQGDLTFDRGIPVLEVDEDVYDYPPDFVIGTVDKIAMMWDQTDAQNIFGLRKGKRRMPPPSLFIQDELHLITGPLGSLDGLYEVMLEELCQAQGGRAPLYIASTATTRQFGPQIQALYGRSGKLVPPPGLIATDSFFSRQDLSQPSRMYVGVCSSGGKASGNLQVSVLGTLAHFAPVLDDEIDKSTGTSIDPYWTNVCFFSSRAALGTLTSLTETDLSSELDTIRRASGSKSGEVKEKGVRTNLRNMWQPREITATSSERVGEVLEDLLIRSDNPDSRSIDLCFATSMIEVGLDVPRLGLMTIIGQPKLSSQYIQVSGRVGRSSRAPALVVDVLGAYNPRDRSHYEHFTSSHRRLYASVEGSSVTPFTVPALDRSAPSVAAILCRILGGGSSIPAGINNYWPRLLEVIVNRASHVDRERGRQNALNALALLRTRAAFPKVPTYEWSSKESDKSFLIAFGSALPADRAEDSWRVLTSMRSVDPDAAGFLHSPTIVISDAGELTQQQDVEDFDI